MSFESAFRRLSLRPSTICRQCRRTLVSSSTRPQQQSATAAFTDIIQSSSKQTSTVTPQLRAQAQIPPSEQSSTPPPTTSEPDRLVPPSSYNTAASVITDIADFNRRKQAEKRQQELERNWNRADLEKQAHRRFRAGDVYAPHDLTGVEQAKWKKLRRKSKQKIDVIDRLGINPIHHYKNFSIMSEYMSDMGRIKHGNETGLRRVNQRRMAKAIRRAIGTGLMPGVHRHPEILRMEMNSRRPT